MRTPPLKDASDGYLSPCKPRRSAPRDAQRIDGFGPPPPKMEGFGPVAGGGAAPPAAWAKLAGFARGWSLRGRGWLLASKFAAANCSMRSLSSLRFCSRVALKAFSGSSFSFACAEHRGRSTRSERPQTRKRNHPRHRETDTSPSKEVKTPQHDGTPRSHLSQCFLGMLHLRSYRVGLLALLPCEAMGRLGLELRLAVHGLDINSFVRQNFLPRLRVAEGVTPSSRRLLGESCRGGGVALLELEARAASRRARWW